MEGGEDSAVPEEMHFESDVEKPVIRETPRHERSFIMPGGDRTGPLGMGPMTGRAAGFCAGYPVPGFANPVIGFGFGGRWGGRGGRGWRNRFYATEMTGRQRNAVAQDPFFPTAATQELPLETLRAQAVHFESALTDIRKRIEELETKGKEK